MTVLDMVRSLNKPDQLTFERIRWERDETDHDIWLCQFFVQCIWQLINAINGSMFLA
jgi:hypothetical protein